jgi:hypothetical protein
MCIAELLSVRITYMYLELVSSPSLHHLHIVDTLPHLELFSTGGMEAGNILISVISALIILCIDMILMYLRTGPCYGYTAGGGVVCECYLLMCLLCCALCCV